MQKRLAKKFFERKTLIVARELLGKYLVRKIGKKVIVGMITETEAYYGFYDRASHASRGRTKRTEIMFGSAGVAYVYFVYGMHYCLNVVTEQMGYPAAVLIRGIEKVNGPGRLTRHFKIDVSLNGENTATSKRIWIEDRKIVIPHSHVVRTPRIGVDYAGAYKGKKWRFVIQ